MCIIIDTNTFSSITDEEAADHDAFKAVLNWICKKEGRAVYGGKKYLKELSRHNGMTKLLVNLSRAGKTVLCDQSAVDLEEERIIEESKNKPKFNDQHLVAIVIVSRCKLLCSKNTSDFGEITNKSYYPKKISPPKIYSNKKCEHLLTKRNLANCCREHTAKKRR